MDKLNFEDLPSEKTPINAQNLNQVQTNMENALKQKVNTYLAGENPDIDSIEFRNISGEYGLYNCTKTPTKGIGILSVFCYTADWVVQEWREPASGKAWRRNFTAGIKWSDWKIIPSIPEIITNENGTAIKFANGIMIQSMTIKKKINASTPKGELFYAPNVVIGNYIESFISKPTCTVTIDCPSSYSVWGTSPLYNGKSSVGNMDIYRAGGATGNIDIIFNIIAIGRWK